jgi:hypothetical protein
MTGRMGLPIFVASQVNPFHRLKRFLPIFHEARKAAGHPAAIAERLDQGVVVLFLEPHGRKITECPVQSASVVYLANKARKSRDHVGMSSVVIEIDLFTLDGLHEALGFAVVVGITTATHRTDEAVVGEYTTIGFGSVLHSAVGVMSAIARWLSGFDRGA